MATTKFTKQPGEVLDYDVDFRTWLQGRSDTAASYEVVTEPGVTLVADTMVNAVVKLILSAGTHGEKYKVTVRMTTAAGLVKEADFLLVIKEV
jgi:hypothetical protein